MTLYEKVILYALRGAMSHGLQALQDYKEYVTSRRINLSNDLYITLAIDAAGIIRTRRRYIPATHSAILNEIISYSEAKVRNRNNPREDAPKPSSKTEKP